MVRVRKNGKVDRRTVPHGRVGAHRQRIHNVLLPVDKDLWGLVRQCAVREEIPVYKVVEEALATRVKWGQDRPYLTFERFATLMTPPTLGQLSKLTKAFHQGKGKARF
jgi:hypothetical protein